MRAIDMHVHPATIEARRQGGHYLEHAESYFGAKPEIVSIEQQAEMYRQLDMMAVLLALDTETATGLPRVTNEFVAKAVQDHPDVFIGFASVDPWKGKLAVRELEHAVRDLGLKGLKLMQIMQGFFPNDRHVYPLYEKCVELGIPVLFHMGMTGMGAGAPGGDGVKLKYARPIPYLDDVAADFPELTIIGAHPAWPWQDEMLAVAVHKQNVYIDLSGWSPKYFPESLVRYANSRLADKCLFGSDFPVITPERWLRDFAEAPFKDAVRPKILLDNARRILNMQ